MFAFLACGGEGGGGCRSDTIYSLVRLNSGGRVVAEIQESAPASLGDGRRIGGGGEGLVDSLVRDLQGGVGAGGGRVDLQQKGKGIEREVFVGWKGRVQYMLW